MGDTETKSDPSFKQTARHKRTHQRFQLCTCAHLLHKWVQALWISALCTHGLKKWQLWSEGTLCKKVLAVVIFVLVLGSLPFRLIALKINEDSPTYARGSLEAHMPSKTRRCPSGLRLCTHYTLPLWGAVGTTNHKNVNRLSFWHWAENTSSSSKARTINRA